MADSKADENDINAYPKAIRIEVNHVNSWDL